MERLEFASQANKTMDSLSLEDLLFDGTGRLETINETFFLLTVSPHSCQCLLIACAINR